MAFLASGPRPPGMASPAPTNKDGAGCPPGWSSPFGLVSGYPVQPGTGNVLPWTTFCQLYPHACPSDWRRRLNDRPAPARRRGRPFVLSTSSPVCGPHGCPKPPSPFAPPPTSPIPRPAPAAPPAPSKAPGGIPPMPEAPPSPLDPDYAAKLRRWRETGTAAAPPGTITVNPTPMPIMPVPGIPGGTIFNPVAPSGTLSRSLYPAQAGTGAVVSRQTVLELAANASRGTGFNTTRAPEGLARSGVRIAGVRSNRRLLGAIVDLDIRNPAVAPHTLAARMVAGSTRVR